MKQIKKYFLLFTLFCLAGSLYLSFPVNSKRGFVTIEENKFKLNGKDFYPVAVNYIAGLYMSDTGKMWPGPGTSYDTDSLQPIFMEDAYIKTLRADMELIKHLGFNSVRIVGIGEEVLDDDTARSAPLSVYARLKNGNDTSVYLYTKAGYKKYFDALEILFKEVNSAGLKVVFLLRVRPNVQTTEQHLIALLSRFKNDTTIMAYDFFNEPLYFDHKARLKTEVDSIVKKWNKLVKMYAPNQLSTIGLEGIREIFEWDPNILDVDFISLHPYEFEPGQVMNEIYWYGNYIKKPWLIGETALPADDDSITYEEQKQFAIKTLKQTFNCGAQGYTWWQYKDVNWHQYRSDYMGVVNRKGETKVTKNNLRTYGTVKPVAEAFKKFNPNEKKDSCICLSNYYNYSEGKASRIIGRLIDEDTGKPIKGGVALGWDEHWVHSYHTISKEDGSFELLGVHRFYHWIATATEYSVIRDDFSPDTVKAGHDGIPTLNIGTLKIKKIPL